MDTISLSKTKLDPMDQDAISNYLIEKVLFTSCCWKVKNDCFVGKKFDRLCKSGIRLRQTAFDQVEGKEGKKKSKMQPLERFELSTPGLQDQCSNRWAIEAATSNNWR